MLDRLSKRDLRSWRAIEETVAATDDDGLPRSPTLYAQVEAAHRARAEFLASGERSIERVSPELRERLAEARVTLAATEAYAEPVEAAVLAERNGAAVPRTAADSAR